MSAEAGPVPEWVYDNVRQRAKSHRVQELCLELAHHVLAIPGTEAILNAQGGIRLVIAANDRAICHMGLGSSLHFPHLGEEIQTELPDWVERTAQHYRIAIEDVADHPEQALVMSFRLADFALRLARNLPSATRDVSDQERVGRMNEFVQEELARRERQSVAAVEAAAWLDEAGILKDSDRRPGRPLRDLLRAGLIQGQRQEPNGRWFIDKAGS